MTATGDDGELIASRALRGAVARLALGLTVAVASCAVVTTRSRDPYAGVAAAVLVFVVTSLLVARWARRRAGTRLLVLSTVVGAGALPALVAVSLYAASRPLIPCYSVDCSTKVETVLEVGGVTTLIPFALAAAVAVGLARLRLPVIERVFPYVGAVALAIATVVTAVAMSHALHRPAVDRYVDALPELGRMRGATFLVSDRDQYLRVSEPEGPEAALLGATWSWRGADAPCHLSVGGGGYELRAVRVQKFTAASMRSEVVCPDIRVRADPWRAILVIDESSVEGFRPAFATNTRTQTSGPLYPDHYTVKDLAPARIWVRFGGGGVLAALALFFARVAVERRHVRAWRAARVGHHRGDGWIALDDDDSPPLHVPSARGLPEGEVRVLGAADARAGGYRTSNAAAASTAVAGQLDSIVADARSRVIATLLLSALLATLVAAPLATALVVLGVG